MAAPETVTGYLALTTTLTDAYTVATGKRLTLSHCQITPKDAANPVDVSLNRTSAANADAVVELCVSETIGINDTGPIYPVSGIIYLNAGDKLQSKASADGDAVLSYSGLLEDV